MKKFFLFILFNITGVITYRFLNKNKLKDNSQNNIKKETEMVSVESQTDLTIIDMLTLLEYKKALENIYDDNLKYDWKFV